MPTTGDLLIGQLEFYWDYHLWPRLQGLTDEEYFWRPVENSWSLRRGADGRFEVEQEESEPDPPPVTTIAWRLVHIGVGCFAIRANTFFNDGSTPADATMFDPRQRPEELPGTAADALEFLQHWYDRWHDGLRSLDADGLNQPLGPKGGYYADDTLAGLVAHINRETMHHGGEIGLLRDLYRAGLR